MEQGARLKRPSVSKSAALPTVFLMDLKQILHLQMEAKNCGFNSKAISSSLSYIHRGLRLLETGAVQSQGYAWVPLPTPYNGTRTWWMSTQQNPSVQPIQMGASAHLALGRLKQEDLKYDPAWVID